jgi:hypothetical protein
MSQKQNKNIPMFNEAVQLQVRNKVLNNQVEEIAKNERILEVVDSDLNTLRRQVEIIEDSSLRKANHVFILKTVLTFAGLAFIPFVLKSAELVSDRIALWSVVALIVVFFLIIFMNLLSIYKRNANRFTLRDFKQAAGQSDKPVLPKRTCLAKLKIKKTPEELELERKLAVLQGLELKFNRIQPRVNILQSRSKDTEREIDKLKAEFREIFGADTTDRAIEVAMRNRIDQRSGQIVNVSM